MELAKKDPEVDLSGNDPAFTPTEYLEEEAAPAEPVEDVEAANAADAVDPSTIPSPKLQGEAPRV